MSRRPRYEIQLQAVAVLWERFHARSPVVERLLRETAPDGYPGSTIGGIGGSELTSVEAAANARLASRDRHDWQTIAATLDTVAQALHAGLAACDRHQRPTPDDLARARCSGGMGQPGALEWGRPDCTNIASSSRGGLCDACRMRRDRWRREGTAA
jgi:hypothetical protein